MPANGPLPDVLASSLAQIVGEVSRDFERDCEVRLSAIQVEITALRADKAEFKLELDRFARDMERRVCERLAELKDGDSVTLDDVRPLILDEIARNFDAIPKSLDEAALESVAGAVVERRMDEIARRAAEVVQQGLPDIQEMVDAAVASRLAALPVDAPAPTLTAEAIAGLFAAEMAEASASHEAITREDVVAIVVEQIAPVAKEVSGRPDAADVGNIIAAELDERVGEIAARAAALVPPALPDVHALVDNAVAAAFATVPVPRNGRDADPEVTAELVREEVSKTAVAIEAAFRPVDAATVATMVAEEVKRAFDAQPAPEPGHTPTADEIRPIVVAEVKAAVAELPPPKPGEPGPPGEMQIAEPWVEGISYKLAIRTHQGSTWQALRDTAREPPHKDWRCLSAAGRDAREWTVHGLYEPTGSYRKFDVVVFNGSEWRAKRDDPGPLPGDGWAISAQIGRQGKPGGPGLKGDPGAPGPKIAAWEIKGYSAIPVLSDGTLGPPLDMTGILESYHQEAVR